MHVTGVPGPDAIYHPCSGRALNASYWQSSFESISDILDLKTDHTSRIAIFCVVPDTLHATAISNHLIAFASLIARRMILLL